MIKEKKGFEAAFDKAVEAVRTYPKNERLMGRLAFVMNLWLHAEPDINKEPYEKKIYAWLVLAADSNDDVFAESALAALCNEEIQKKNYDKAQEYIDRLVPKKQFDKRIIQANLYIEKGDFDSAYVLYEKKISEEVNVLLGTLSLLSELKCKEKDYDTALRIGELSRIMGEEFCLGAYQTNMTKLIVYVRMQDADNVIVLLEQLLADIDHLASQKCYLNEHIKKENIKENEMLKNVLKKMTELEELDFLREDVRFKKIVNQLESGQ